MTELKELLVTTQRLYYVMFQLRGLEEDMQALTVEGRLALSESLVQLEALWIRFLEIHKPSGYLSVVFIPYTPKVIQHGQTS